MRSLSQLLEVIEQLEARRAFFRSLMDPIDTSSPQGRFTLQVLGAAAEFERALIRERSKAGLASARTKGRVGGNPGLRARDPAALRKVRLARQDGFLPGTVLARAGRRETDNRLPAIVAAIKGADPTSRFGRSAAGWKRCARERPAGGQAGSRHP